MAATRRYRPSRGHDSRAARRERTSGSQFTDLQTTDLSGRSRRGCDGRSGWRAACFWRADAKEDELDRRILIYRAGGPAVHRQADRACQNFANQAVIAIENARLLNELRERTGELARSVEELRALGQVSQAVNSTLDLKTVLDHDCREAVQLSGTEAGTIYEFDEQQRDLLFRSTYGMDDSAIAALKDHHLGISEPTIDQAVRKRTQPVQISDVREIPPTPARDITSRAGTAPCSSFHCSRATTSSACW